jgi:hypothetical protein
MLNALGSSQYIKSATPSAAGLENQLRRYQQQLSDCINCPSTSKSPESRETARTLSDKISNIKSRIEEVANTKPPIASVEPPNRNSQPYSNAPTATLGNYLNLYA